MEGLWGTATAGFAADLRHRPKATLGWLGYLGPITLETMDLLVGRKSLSSAGSGGRRHTQELLDFCGLHGIVADVEVLPSAQVMTALERLEHNDVRYRFVLDPSDL